MSIFYSTPARNPLVPEMMPDTSRLSAAEAAEAAAYGRQIHAAGIRPCRRDMSGSWQSAEPPSWNSNSPTDSDCAAVGLDAGLSLGFFIYVLPDSVGLRDLAPEGVQALDDNYLTDGNDRWVVLAHGLDVSEDLKIGGATADPILDSYEVATGNVVVSPTIGCTFEGEGSYNRWLSRHSDSDTWQLLEAKPSAAAILAGWNEDEALLGFFDVTPDGAKLKAKNDRIASVRFRRADLPENWQDALWNLPVEVGGALVLVSPSFVTIYLELATATIGSPYGVKLVDIPEELHLAGGKVPSLTVSRGSGQRVHMDPIPGSGGCYLLGGVGRPLRLLDRGTDQKGVLLAGWPPAPLPTPIS